MAYVIQASPISKIFIPSWHRQCLDKPELVMDNRVKFEITVPRSVGAIVLQHNVPVHASSLIPNTGRREIDSDEVRNLIPWLTGGNDSVETDTDIYGVVLLKLEKDMNAEITELVSIEALALAEEGAQEEYLKRQQARLRAMMDQMKRAVLLAKDTADDRVKRALRVTHQNLKVEWARIEQAGGRAYDASVAEALGALVLTSEIESQTEDQSKLRGIIGKAMSSIRANGGV